MKHQMNVLMTVLVLISLSIYQPANAQTTLPIEGVFNEHTSIITDVTIPCTDELSLNIRGGDGGDVLFVGLTCNTHIHGGTGAKVQISYKVSETEDDALKPNGTLRLYRGFRGGTRTPNCWEPGTELSGGGGGATAVLYLPPGEDALAAKWILLAVAGGGGGAVEPGGNPGDRVGGGGMTGKNGGNSGNSMGGSYTNCPEKDFCDWINNKQGIGAGLRCNEGDELREGKDMYISSFTLEGGNLVKLKVKPNNFYFYTGGIADGPNQKNGGYGFFGGGCSGAGGGGGGGFYGGAVECQQGGGGGGSWASDQFGASNKIITAGVDGGTVSSPNHGFIEITTAKLPANAICPPVTVELDENGNKEFIAADYLSNSFIPCGGIAHLFMGIDGVNSAAANVTTFDCDDIGQNFTIAVNILEQQGAVGTVVDQCNSTITVVDVTGPNAKCQNITISLDEYGDKSITPADVNNGSADACPDLSVLDILISDGIASYTLSKMDFNCSNIGDNDVTLTVEDIYGNTSNCTATVTVEDNTAPNAICKDNHMWLFNGTAGVHPDFINNGSNDACGIVSKSLSQSLFTCADVGDVTLTLTIEDANGNTSQCSSTLTVYEFDEPEEACKNTSVMLDPSGHASITTDDIDDGSTDACGIASMTLNKTTFDCNDIGDNSVTMTIMDVNGNTSACTATVTVEENTPPSALCKDNWIWLDYDGTISIGPGHMNNGSDDACGIASLSLSQYEFTCADVGDKLVTLTVEDVNGNTAQCTSTLSVYDTDSPFWLCKNPTIALDATGYASITTDDIDDGSTDACGIASMTLNRTNFSCDDIGENSVTMTLVDLHGNSSSCHATVTIIEGTNLPDAWQSTDIGHVTVGNLYEFSPCFDQNGEFSVIGSGNNTMSATTDHVAFAHQTLCGDGTITAKIESVEPNGYGGLMIRETEDEDAKQVALFSNQTNMLRHEVRYNPNTPKQIGNFFKPNPIWLRLERQGDWIFSYSSFDGVNFQYVHSVFLSMESCVEVGLSSFTFMPGSQTEAVFSNVSVSGGDGGFSSNNNTPTPDTAPLSTTNYSLFTVKLFPNPNNGHFTVQLDEPLTEQTTLHIYNSYGQQIHSEVVEPGISNTQINLNQLQSGTYWLRLNGVNQVLATNVFTVTK